jgi:hypothetical protein
LSKLIYCCFVIPDLIRNPVLFSDATFLDAGSSPARHTEIRHFSALRHSLLRGSDGRQQNVHTLIIVPYICDADATRSKPLRT